jgi:hypothetical protein
MRTFPNIAHEWGCQELTWLRFWGLILRSIVSDQLFSQAALITDVWPHPTH